MRVLLDTHTLIWFTEGNDRLSERAKSEISNVNNDNFISMVSLWEIVIKSSNGKLELKQTFNKLNQFLSLNNIQILNIQVNHLTALLSLPHHHKDPFDRLLIAQAISENLLIISADRHFDAYSINVIW